MGAAARSQGIQKGMARWSRRWRLLLSIHWSVCVPTLTCGCELCIVTERTRLEQVAKTRFLQRVAGLSLRVNLTKLLLGVERSQLRWLRHLFAMLPADCSN